MTARYVYCLVRVDADADGAGESGTGRTDATLDAAGLDDAPTRLIRAEGGVGAVVHDCASLYDTDDEAQLRLWLLAHQRVVDAATATFGTPLPVRFDTVIQGDDEAVRTWLADVADEARPALDRLAGTREYRVTAHWTPDGGGEGNGAGDGDSPTSQDGDDGLGAFEARARQRDDRLAELAAEREAADTGRAFLVSKQYDRRLRELERERLSELAADLREHVAPATREVRDADAEAGGADLAAADGDDAGELIARLTVLADEADEDELGARLDEFVEANDVTVRFTGPWAPYSFAPELS